MTFASTGTRIHRGRLLFAGALLFPPSALAIQSFMCVADHSSGFSFDASRKGWQSSTFNIEKSRYIVKNTVGQKWSVERIGESESFAWCDEGFTSEGFLNCEGSRRFQMNRKNLRFLSAYLIGYVHDGLGSPAFGKEGENSPFLEIGKCSKLTQ